MLVCVTGGVGSGKSTVTRLLVERGAVVIDADALAREVVEPGMPGFDAVVARFGPGVVLPSGGLDRPAIAAIVFNDSQALTDLNAIVHPAVRARATELLAAAPTGGVVVYDIPLFVETRSGRGEFDIIVAVETSLEVRLARLAERGMTERDALARIAKQATDEQRRAVADVVIDNNGTLDDLRAQVDTLWPRLVSGG
jgi:dephospho-CoA kinase